MMELSFDKGIRLEPEVAETYRELLPIELIEIWNDYGLVHLLDGYLRMINPKEYQDFIEKTYFRGSVSIPIFATAFGDIITLEEGQYIGLIKYKNGTFHIIAKSFQRFMNNLSDEYFLEKYFQIPQYAEAVNRLGKLEADECFGYVPLLVLGGNETVSHLEKMKQNVYLDLISQISGMIGV